MWFSRDVAWPRCGRHHTHAGAISGCRHMRVTVWPVMVTHGGYGDSGTSMAPALRYARVHTALGTPAPLTHASHGPLGTPTPQWPFRCPWQGPRSWGGTPVAPRCSRCCRSPAALRHLAAAGGTAARCRDTGTGRVAPGATCGHPRGQRGAVRAGGSPGWPRGGGAGAGAARIRS